MNISGEIPTKFAFLSRKKGETKVIHNLNELFIKCRENWPEFDWLYIYVSHNLFESVQTFSGIRFCYSIHCSGIINSVFMHSNTIIFELRTKEPYPNLIQLSKLTGKMHYMIEDISINHSDFRLNMINITFQFESIKKALIHSRIF